MKYRRSARQVISNGALALAAHVAKRTPMAQPSRHGVEVLRDLCYQDSNHVDHRLDIYRPLSRPGPWPVVMYVHGGAFSLLSKDTHWVMGLAFARHGYLVINVSYRLAPEHPFPSAIADVCAAWKWVAENAERYGGDLGRVAVAGESAGGNLAAALTLATTQRRPEPWARAAFDTGLAPHAALPFCAMLQVSSPQRYYARRPMPWWVRGALDETSASYLQDLDHGDTLDLADPLVVFERNPRLDRPLPPFFAAVGTRDPLLDDTRRLEKALRALGVPCEARYYPGGIHAFHAMVWSRDARRCWRDALAFLDRHLRVRRERYSVPPALATG